VNEFPAAEFVASVIWIICAATAVAGALVAALSTRIIRSVSGLAMCCVGLAGLYYFLNSPFLALMEVLIYLGAVCVNVVFAVMLAEPDEPARARMSSNRWWAALALVVSGGVLWGLVHLSLAAPRFVTRPPINDGSVHAIGVSMLTTHSFAFELISVVLLVAIVGALAVARPGRTRSA
jgi:NADH-quinone oxidoreductase subunit J